MAPGSGSLRGAGTPAAYCLIASFVYRFAAATRWETRMLTRRTIALLFAAVSLAATGSASAQGKIAVYTSNDSNLNRFVFDAFKKETGIEVEPVEAGSGVVFRRMASERE